MRIQTFAAAVLLATGLTAQTTCKFDRIDPSCGPVLRGTANAQSQSHVLTFAVSAAPKNAFGLLAFGSTQLNFRFPGTACFLLLDPRVVVPFYTNQQGLASKSIGVPSSVAFTILSQSGHDDSGALVTANALRLTCQ